MTLFDLYKPQVSIDKPIRLIEAFAGIGSQSMALRNIGADFEVHRCYEIDKYAMASYNAIHGTNFEPTDICTVKGVDMGIEDKERFTYLLTYSFPCFAGDTMVMTTNGLKLIKDVTVGDKVLTHTNTYKRVINSQPTGEKEIYLVKGMCFDEIKCTANHKFFVRKMTRHFPTYKNGKRGNVRLFGKPEFVECNELDKSFYMGIAINPNSIIPTWDGIEYTWSDGRKSRHKNQVSKYLEKKEFWWLIGRYVGDGWHRSQGGIIICSAKDETHEITEIVNSLGINTSIVAERTVDKIHFADKEIEKFVEPFGRGAENKRIPGFVFDLPQELIKAFVDGYVSADGSFTQGLYKTSSVSRELSYGIAQCVAKAYKTPFSIYKSKRKEKSTIEGRVINQRESWQVTWKTEKRKQDHAFYEDGYIWFPIKRIEKTGNAEMVYDIEVEQDHSFTANGVIVHNCTDISIAGRMAGMAEDSNTRSSLLWQIKRILEELKEIDALPQILLMENVPAIHSPQNIDHFQKWTGFLTDLGYSSYCEDLNAVDFGVAQNRERTFLVSILGEYAYTFPAKMDLNKCIEDYFEDLTEEQAEKYVVKSQKALDLLVKLDEENRLD